MKKQTGNNYAFIDSQNLNLAIRGQGWILDFKRFRRYIKDRFNVTKAFFFIGYIKENEKLYTFLKKSGYTLIFKPTLEYKKGSKSETKGNVDAELVLHSAAIEYDNYDKALIVSGDGDFYCLIDYLKQKNKFLRLVVPNRYRYSSLLRKFLPDIVFMNNLKEKLGLKKE